MTVEAGAAPSPAGAPELAVRRTTPPRYPCFDGLRALAALAVFFFHVVPSLRPGWYTWGLGEWLAGLGSLGVRTFFIISGFLLYRPFVAAFFENRPPPGAIAFWRRRLLRVFPAYWIALTAYVFVFGFAELPDLETGIAFYGLTQNYRFGSVTGGLFVAWTLVIEVSFYLVLPILAWGLRALSARQPSLRAKFASQIAGLVALFAFGTAVRVWGVWGNSGGGRKWFPMAQVLTWLPGFLDVFAVGMLFAVLSAWLAAGGRVTWPIEALGRYAGVCWLLALEAYWVSMQFNKPTVAFAKLTNVQIFGIPTMDLLVAALLVLPAVFGPQDTGVVRAFLRTRVLVFLGAISYGVYLWHDTVLKVVRDELGPEYLVDNPMVSLALILGVTILVGYANHRLIERPLARLTRTGRAAKA